MSTEVKKDHPFLLRTDKEIDEILHNLAPATDELINKIPESLFVRNYLPVFCGEEPPEGLTAQEALRQWIQIAGLQFLPVKVLDDRSGEILFEVPALLDRHAVYVGREKENTPRLSELMKTATSYAQIHPEAGTNYILRNLRDYRFIGASPKFRERVRQWNEIFRRYGKAEILIEEKDGRYDLRMGEPVKPGTLGDVEDELIYD